MGTTKRVKKAVKKKAVKKKVVKKVAVKKKVVKKVASNGKAQSHRAVWALVSEVDTLSAELERAATALSERVTALQKRDIFPQGAMVASLRLDRLRAVLKVAVTAVEGAALAHRDGGEFEHGQIAVSFPESGGGRRPAWKPEATKQAAQCARLEYGMTEVLDVGQRAQVSQAAAQYRFDVVAYEEAVKAATQPGKPVIKVKFTESA